MFKVEAVVVGAGVIGLAIARALALRGVKVVVLEKERVIGSGTSSFVAIVCPCACGAAFWIVTLAVPEALV